MKSRYHDKNGKITQRTAHMLSMPQIDVLRENKERRRKEQRVGSVSRADHVCLLLPEANPYASHTWHAYVLRTNASVFSWPPVAAQRAKGTAAWIDIDLSFLLSFSYSLSPSRSPPPPRAHIHILVHMNSTRSP